MGRYLFDRPRDVLFELADSANPWERRTAIVATSYFIRQRDLATTFAIAEMLVHDEHELVQRPVGGWLREAGKQDRTQLEGFLNRHAVTMPRTALRFAIEHFDEESRSHYLGLRKTADDG